MDVFDYPKISVWITSTGRYDLVKRDIESFTMFCSYPNWQWIIFESVPTKDSLEHYNTPLLKSAQTIEYLKTVPNVHKLMIEDWPPWGDVWQKLLDATDTDYFINLEDDWTTVYDPHEWFVDAIKLLRRRPDLYALTGNLQRPEFGPGWPGWKEIVDDGEFRYALGMLVSAGGMLSKTAAAKQVGFPTGHELKAGNISVPGNPEGLFGDRILNAGLWGGRLLDWYGWFCSQNDMSVGGHDPKGAQHVRIQADMIRRGMVGKVI